MGLDLSLTRLSSFGVESDLIALALLPSRNSTSLHAHHGGSLLFNDFVEIKKMIVGEQKDDVGCLANNEDNESKCMLLCKKYYGLQIDLFINLKLDTSFSIGPFVTYGGRGPVFLKYSRAAPLPVEQITK